MKNIKQILTMSAAVVALAVSCKDEELDPYIKPEGNAHGFGQFVSLVDGTTLLPARTVFYSQAAVDAVTFFDQANQANGVQFDLEWASIDNRVNISTIELYMEYNETYSDVDRNPLIAAHGGPSKGPTYPAGTLWQTITPTGPRQAVRVTVTPNDVFTLFQNNTFDYGAGERNIFSAPIAGEYRRTRTTAGSRFFSTTNFTVPGVGVVPLAADQFRIRWRLIADDGTAYGSWSNSVCAETIGINCTLQWRVNSQVFNPRVTIARETNAKAFLQSGNTTTMTLTYTRPIATPPTVTISPAQGTLGAVTAVSGTNNQFRVTYTAPAGFTGAVTATIAGAVSGGSGATAGLTQVSSTQVLNVDNQIPIVTSATSSATRVGRGQSTTFTVNFNEAMSAVAADALRISIAAADAQGLDAVPATNMTLAANGLSATYLYLWRDSSNPFDNTHGNVIATISGGKDLAGNAFAGTTISFLNDVGATVTDPISATGSVSGVTSAPTPTFIADLGTQLHWSIAQGATQTGAAGSAVTGQWFWVALRYADLNADGDTDDPGEQPLAPIQATRTVTGLANPVYNGFNLTNQGTGTANRVSAQGSTTASGVNFTPFTPNGKFDVYLYFVSSTGNVSANTATPLTITMQ